MENHYSHGTDLDLALKFVMESPSDFYHKQRFHSVFLRTKFYLPTLKNLNNNESEPFTPLRLYDNNETFFIAFDTEKRYEKWLDLAQGTPQDISLEEIFGHELIECLGPSVHLCLNPGNESYYEIGPDQIQFLKTVIAKTQAPVQPS